MGVMRCHISDCDSIMCSTYVDRVGYVCNSCQDNFKEWMLAQTPLYMDSENFILDKLEEFSKIPVDQPDDTEYHDVRDKLNSFFRDHDINY